MAAHLNSLVAHRLRNIGLDHSFCTIGGVKSLLPKYDATHEIVYFFKLLFSLLFPKQVKIHHSPCYSLFFVRGFGYSYTLLKKSKPALSMVILDLLLRFCYLHSKLFLTRQTLKMAIKIRFILFKYK